MVLVNLTGYIFFFFFFFLFMVSLDICVLAHFVLIGRTLKDHKDSSFCFFMHTILL